MSINPQPLRLLQLLLQYPGQTVSREQIQKCLWGENTFVDVERGINFCINQIRASLGDNAEKPRYVETVPRRGYRFVAPVEAEATSGSGAKGNSGRKEFRSIGVLPFENLSGDPTQDYFADGMSEALTTELGKISALRVISRQSMVQYKGAKKTMPEIARELNVDTVVEGSVLRAGERIRVAVQLIEAELDRHLWANSYEREARDVLALHGDVARNVVKKIKVTLTPQEETRLGERRAINPAANEAYFRGRYFLDRRTKENLQQAFAAFQQSIELDPRFAPAYASLAETHLSLSAYDPAHQQELFMRAKEASLKALELDNTVSAAHYTLAVNHVSTWNWRSAEQSYLRAIEVNPSNASAHWWYADLLIMQGRMKEAEAELHRAEALNPVSLEIYWTAIAFHYYAHRYEEMIDRCQGLVKRNAALDWRYHHALGAAYVQMGRYEEAVSELSEALKSSTMYEHTATEFANALAVAGKREEALRIMEGVKYVPWKTFGLALVHAGLGEKDEAVRCLEKAIELRAPLVIVMKVDPRFELLRKNRRFGSLIRKMNLPE